MYDVYSSPALLKLEIIALFLREHWWKGKFKSRERSLTSVFHLRFFCEESNESSSSILLNFFFLFLNPKNVLFLKILIFLSYSDGLPDSSLATENTHYPSTASSFTLPTRSSKIHAHDAALQHLFPQVLRKRGRKWVSSLMQEHNANSSQSTAHHCINKK